jgi:hypothetical protein
MITSIAWTKPDIQFESKLHDFGEIEDGKVITIEFKFKNSGDSQLIIKNISTSCGCTVAKLKKRKYKPGETGIIPVKFFSTGRGGRKVSKSITISSNDKDTPYTRLIITGKVVLKNFASINVKPDRIIFRDVTMGKQYSQKIQITNIGNSDLKIFEVTHHPEILPVFPVSAIQPNQKIEVEIFFTPKNIITSQTFQNRKRGRIVSYLKIRSNAYRQYYTMVKIEAKVTKYSP